MNANAHQSTVVHGPELFRFESSAEWRRRDRACLESFALAIDTVGRVCSQYCDYERAEREGTFPVRVFHTDPDFSPNVHEHAGVWADELPPPGSLPRFRCAPCPRCGSELTPCMAPPCWTPAEPTAPGSAR